MSDTRRELGTLLYHDFFRWMDALDQGSGYFQPSPFLDLPAEIRLTIYSMTAPAFDIPELPNSMPTAHTQTYALMRVCRQTYCETQALFYRTRRISAKRLKNSSEYSFGSDVPIFEAAESWTAEFFARYSAVAIGVSMPLNITAYLQQLTLVQTHVGDGTIGCEKAYHHRFFSVPELTPLLRLYLPALRMIDLGRLTTTSIWFPYVPTEIGLPRVAKALHDMQSLPGLQAISLLWVWTNADPPTNSLVVQYPFAADGWMARHDEGDHEPPKVLSIEKPASDLSSASMVVKEGSGWRGVALSRKETGWFL